MMSDAGPKIAVSGLRKSFGRKRVLDGVEIACGAGESLVIIGGSGTGKSVLIKCIIGLHRPDAGSVRIDGVETAGLRRAARDRLIRKFGMTGDVHRQTHFPIAVEQQMRAEALVARIDVQLVATEDAAQRLVAAEIGRLRAGAA